MTVQRAVRPHALALLAAFACAAPLAAQDAQDAPRRPALLRVAASSDGTVLSLDSSSIARTGDSIFVVDAVFQFPADSARRADHEVDHQEMDCARNRFRWRTTTFFVGYAPVRAAGEDAAPVAGWQPVDDGELPIFQAICGYLLGSFAASLPVTLELSAVDRAPELANVDVVRRALARENPPALRAAGIGGTVQVRFQLTALGSVDSASARALWASDPRFADAALNVIRVMRFRPARRNGEPAAVWLVLPVTFVPPGGTRP